MSSSRTKILIIDDDMAILHALQLFLKQEGYDVEAVTGYKDYFKKLKPSEYPDLLILDILLSEESGYEIAKQLKSDKKTKAVPIIMISAHPSGGEMAEKAGVEVFLAKPFDMDSLLGAVEGLSPQKA